MLGKVSCSVGLVDILSKTMEELYGISHVARYADCIFWGVIPCCQIFCINEMKSALLMLYVINRVFLASNVL